MIHFVRRSLKKKKLGKTIKSAFVFFFFFLIIIFRYFIFHLKVRVFWNVILSARTETCNPDGARVNDYFSVKISRAFAYLVRAINPTFHSFLVCLKIFKEKNGNKLDG